MVIGWTLILRDPLLLLNPQLFTAVSVISEYDSLYCLKRVRNCFGMAFCIKMHLRSYCTSGAAIYFCSAESLPPWVRSTSKYVHKICAQRWKPFAVPYRLSSVKTEKRMWDNVLVLSLLPLGLCPSGPGSSPAVLGGNPSSVQACLSRAGRGSGTKRSLAGVNGRAPGNRTCLLSKPQGTQRQRTRLRAVHAHPFAYLCPCRTQIHAYQLRAKWMFHSHL